MLALSGAARGLGTDLEEVPSPGLILPFWAVVHVGSGREQATCLCFLELEPSGLLQLCSVEKCHSVSLWFQAQTLS